MHWHQDKRARNRRMDPSLDPNVSTMETAQSMSERMINKTHASKRDSLGSRAEAEERRDKRAREA